MSGDAGLPHPRSASSGPAGSLAPAGEVTAGGSSTKNSPAVDLTLAAQVDDLCDRFEAACKGSSPPRLEEFIGQLPLSAEELGFRELLELDLVYRRRAGQRPAIDDYQARFPQFTAAIDSIFGRTLVQPPPANKRAGPALPTPARNLAETMLADDPRAAAAGSSSNAAGTIGTPTSSGLRFRVLRPHAKGGLGEVFVAEDQELHRQVALKQIQARFADDTESRSRFVVEAEVTGALEHPGIVPVYGLGMYPDGRPFYAMRFIHGDSLKDAIDQFHDSAENRRDPGRRTLELRKLLGRFIAVCDALQYAHSRRIVHRDLKPANIMLGEFGETLVVDWGLAKSIDRPIEHEEIEPKSIHAPLALSGTAATQMGLAVGTPQFMSPEQAAGRPDLVGPHSDIYSLGATLYCLLTGEAPLSDRSVRNLMELLRRVREGDIPPPRAINSTVPRPLDAICRKAMALVPEDRYGSARLLADDLEHWLADEPISAQPDTLTQRVARWTRRHRAWALAIGVALLLVSVVSSVAGVLINHQRQLAEEDFRQARDAVDELFTKVSEDTLLNQPGMQGLRKELLQKTLEYYQRFLQQRADDPAVQDELALTFFRAGRIIEELDSPEKGLDYYQKARARQEQLLAKTPADRQRLQALSDTENAIGRALQKGRKFDAALKAYQQSREIRQQLVDLDPHDKEYQRALANTVMNIGLVERNLNRLAEAQRDIELAQVSRRAQIAAGDDSAKLQRDLAMGYYDQGYLELTMGDAAGKLKHSDEKTMSLRAAQQHFEAAIQQFQQLFARDPRDLTAQYLTAICNRLLGDLQGAASQAAESQRLYGLARDTLTRLTEQNPDVSEYKAALAGVYMNLTLRQQGAERLKSFESARKLLTGLVDNYPENPQFGRDLVVTLRSLADLQSKAGQRDAARANLQAALDLLTRLTAKFPTNAEFKAALESTRTALDQLAH